MKALQFQAILLALLIVMPLVLTSVTQVSDMQFLYELCENGGEEEQTEERESEKKESNDGVEEFSLNLQAKHLSMYDRRNLYYIQSDAFASNSTDVLTPPPEFI